VPTAANVAVTDVPGGKDVIKTHYVLLQYQLFHHTTNYSVKEIKT
jgi:hypothetical protein